MGISVVAVDVVGGVVGVDVVGGAVGVVVVVTDSTVIDDFVGVRIDSASGTLNFYPNPLELFYSLVG